MPSLLLKTSFMKVTFYNIEKVDICKHFSDTPIGYFLLTDKSNLKEKYSYEEIKCYIQSYIEKGEYGLFDKDDLEAIIDIINECEKEGSVQITYSLD